MTEPAGSRSELYLRFSRRSMAVLLLLITTLGGLAIVTAIRPGGVASQWLQRVSLVAPVMIAIAAALLQTTLRGHRWNANSPEVKAVMNDEWRRTNLDRAMRIAFMVILIVQLPMGWLLGVLAHLPALRVALAMATSTITLGMTVFLSLFLIFDRD